MVEEKLEIKRDKKESVEKNHAYFLTALYCVGSHSDVNSVDGHIDTAKL